jgi:hypothetical protein
MTRMRRRRTVRRRTSIPRIAWGYSGLLWKLGAADSKLKKARKR